MRYHVATGAGDYGRYDTYEEAYRKYLEICKAKPKLTVALYDEKNMERICVREGGT